MSLLVFLVITIILCSLILLVQAGEGKYIKIMAIVAIAIEVIYLLVIKETIDLPAQFHLSVVIPCCTGLFGLICLIKLSERALPVLIFFTSLIQLFMETKIIDKLI